MSDAAWTQKPFVIILPTVWVKCVYQQMHILDSIFYINIEPDYWSCACSTPSHILSTSHHDLETVQTEFTWSINEQSALMNIHIHVSLAYPLEACTSLYYQAWKNRNLFVLLPLQWHKQPLLATDLPKVPTQTRKKSLS